MPFIYLFSPLALWLSTQVHLNRNGESGQPCLVPDRREY